LVLFDILEITSVIRKDMQVHEIVQLRNQVFEVSEVFGHLRKLLAKLILFVRIITILFFTHRG
jgi:hypothetical protein